MPDPTAAPSPVKSGVSNFFTLGTVGTFAGSVTALTITVNVLYDAMGVGSKPLTLGIALFLSIGTCLWSTSARGRKLVGAMVIAVVNGLLIYGAAYGVDMTMIAKPSPDQAALAPAEPPPARPPVEPGVPEPAPPPPEIERSRIDVRQEGPFGNRVVIDRRLIERVPPGGG